LLNFQIRNMSTCCNSKLFGTWNFESEENLAEAYTSLKLTQEELNYYLGFYAHATLTLSCLAATAEENDGKCWSVKFASPTSKFDAIEDKFKPGWGQALRTYPICGVQTVLNSVFVVESDKKMFSVMKKDDDSVFLSFTWEVQDEDRLFWSIKWYNGSVGKLWYKRS